MSVPRYAYFQGKIVPYSEAKVGVMNHTLNYGTGAFGGIRGYWNPEEEQLFLFRVMDHLHRLLKSARLISAEIGLEVDELRSLAVELTQREGLRRDCYLRPLVYNTDEIIGVRLHDLHADLAMFVVPFDRYVERDTDAHVTVSSWRRLDDNSLPARGKITGAYVSSALIKTDAVRSGFDEALVLSQDGHLSEGSAENVFLVRDDVLITPPVTDNILEGITRRTIMLLAREELGLRIAERAIDRSEVYICDELFLTGTAAQVTAVTRVDHRPVGAGTMGPITDAAAPSVRRYGARPDPQVPALERIGLRQRARPRRLRSNSARFTPGCRRMAHPGVLPYIMDVSPPRTLGLLLGTAILLTGLAGAGVGLANLTEFSPALFLWGSLPIVGAAAAALAGYRLYGLLTARYLLNREGIGVRWGVAVEEIPLASVRIERPSGAVAERLRPASRLRWPGCVVGSGFVDGLGRVEFFSTRGPADTLLVISPTRILAISPPDPEAFLQAFHDAARQGSLDPITARSERPELLPGQLWTDRPARLAILVGLALPVSLLGYLGLVSPGLPDQVAFGFGPSGAAGPLVGSGRLLLFPLVGVLCWSIDLVLGAVLYRRERDRWPAFALWIAAVTVGILLWAAVILHVAPGPT